MNVLEAYMAFNPVVLDTSNKSPDQVCIDALQIIQEALSMSNRRFQMEKFLHGKNHHKRRTNRNRPAPRSFRQNFGDDSGHVKVDLHTLALHNAKKIGSKKN